MSPEEAREQTLEILQATIAASGASDWVLDRDDVPLPQQCEIDGKEGVAFNHGGYAVTERANPAADAQRVAEYWASVGIDARVVSDPVPRVFGGGGRVDAISFSTSPGYTICVGGTCVPGNAFEFYSPSPSN
ncbi:hypothetical protein [Microbacterium sp. IEGM 1404]|uniref:hypothetical protein n=1 Tax=Microbacterium sp. IEGM 1404 TaxID=3047084 RepID=UPI0024B6CAFA|nr:hypothetical protein [Microbacterium sp. IEGM 1404]MDI9892424.1 hypothetical protein [Microbacterium sp. IEGM 1404]